MAEFDHGKRRVCVESSNKLERKGGKGLKARFRALVIAESELQCLCETMFSPVGGYGELDLGRWTAPKCSF